MPMSSQEKQIVTNDSNHLWEYFDAIARQRTQIFLFLCCYFYGHFGPD